MLLGFGPALLLPSTGWEFTVAPFGRLWNRGVDFLIYLLMKGIIKSVVFGFRSDLDIASSSATILLPTSGGYRRATTNAVVFSSVWILSPGLSFSTLMMFELLGVACAVIEN